MKGTKSLSAKISFAYLKDFQNDEEWCFLFWNILLSFQRYSSFVQKLMTSPTVHLTAINHNIENIGCRGVVQAWQR